MQSSFPTKRLLWAVSAGALAAAAVGICLLPYHTTVSPGGEGSAQWAVEAWLAGGKAWSLRQLTAGLQPYGVLVPAMASPALQALRQALVKSPRWQGISSLLHALLLGGSLLVFCLLFLLSLMVAVSSIGAALVFVWHLGGLALAAILGVQGWRARQAEISGGVPRRRQ